MSSVSNCCSWNTTTPFLVLVNYTSGNISWVSRLSFPYIIYYKDEPEKSPYTVSKSGSNLLKFITDFYDSLPGNIIVVNQNNLADVLNDSSFVSKYSESVTPGFWNFNSCTIGSIINELVCIRKSGWWTACMEPYFGAMEGYGDFAGGKKGGSQFVVSRERILSLPVGFYRGMNKWLIANSLENVSSEVSKVTNGDILSTIYKYPLSNLSTSRYLEWSWELIFTVSRMAILPRSYPGSGLLALYGAGSYYRNVTEHVTKYFLQDGKLVIPKTAKFNDLFSDSLCGATKKLEISYGGVTCMIDEQRNVTISTE